MREDGKKDTLTHSPLVVVLFQVVFSPILQMETYIPEIQGILRKIEFPNYREINGKRLIADENGQMTLSDNKQWVFSDAKMQTSIILDCQTITFQTFGYDFYERYLYRIYCYPHFFKYRILSRGYP